MMPEQVGLGCLRTVAEQAIEKRASKQYPFMDSVSVLALGSFLSSCPDIFQWWIVSWKYKPNKPFPHPDLFWYIVTAIGKQTRAGSVNILLCPWVFTLRWIFFSTLQTLCLRCGCLCPRFCAGDLAQTGSQCLRVALPWRLFFSILLSLAMIYLTTLLSVSVECPIET